MTPRHLLALSLCALGLTLPALSCLYLQDHFPGSPLGDGGMPPSSDSVPSADLGANCPENAKCWNLTNGGDLGVTLFNAPEAGLLWNNQNGLVLTASAKPTNTGVTSAVFDNAGSAACKNLWEVQVSQSVDGYDGKTNSGPFSKVISIETEGMPLWEKNGNLPVGPIAITVQTSGAMKTLTLKFDRRSTAADSQQTMPWWISRVIIRCLSPGASTP